VPDVFAALRTSGGTKSMPRTPASGPGVAPKLSKRQKYDYRDIDWRELKLIRVGHAIWALYKRERSSQGSTGLQIRALLGACETIWELKKQLN